MKYTNVVYVLIDITEGKYYLGSKTECCLCDLRGVKTLVTRGGRAYYGSSKNKSFIASKSRGNRIAVEVLQVVPNRDQLLKVEQEWLREFKVASDTRFYNLTEKTFGSNIFPMQNESICNSYGESVKKLAKSRGSVSRRYSSASELGWDKPHEMYYHILKQLELHNGAEVSRSFGKHRHFARVTTKCFNLSRYETDDIKNNIPEMRDLFIEGVSYELISEILDIDLLSVYEGLYLFTKKDVDKYLTAKQKGLTDDELDTKVAKLILLGSSFQECSRELSIDRRTVQRYFIRFFRRRFKINDLK